MSNKSKATNSFLKTFLHTTVKESFLNNPGGKEIHTLMSGKLRIYLLTYDLQLYIY